MVKVKILFLIGVLILAGCSGGGNADEDLPATATLAPIVSFTPRLTATPFATLTPLPTFTYTPSITPIPPTATETPVPSPTPQVTGIISSLQTVNIRQGPGTSFSAFVALNPGTGVIVLGQNEDGSWYEVELEDGDRGWVSAALVRLQPTPSPIPTFTATPDLTALALGTPLPTAILGGGTITPTPPRAAVTATPVGTDDPGEVDADDDADGVAVAAETTATEAFLPIRDVTALYQTATALAGGFSPPTPRPNPQATASPTGQSPNIPAPVVTGATSTPPAVTPVSSGNTRVQQGVDVFALCNNERLGVSAPTNLAPGSTIDIYWAWIMSDDQYLAQHLDAVNYEIRINDTLLNWRQFGIPVRQEGSNWVKYWFVPYGPLESGDYLITYRATWSEPIFDGFEMFGPGTRNPVEEGSCTFTVQ